MKKSFTVSVLDEEGEAITKFFTYPCTGKGFEKLIDKISSLKLEKGKTVIGIEDKIEEILSFNEPSFQDVHQAAFCRRSFIVHSYR